MVVHAALEDLCDLPPAGGGNGEHAVRIAHVCGEQEDVLAGGCEGAGMGNGSAYVSNSGAAREVVPEGGFNAVIHGGAQASATVENVAPFAGCGLGNYGEG